MIIWKNGVEEIKQYSFVMHYKMWFKSISQHIDQCTYYIHYIGRQTDIEQIILLFEHIEI
uniref:Uncharacterized protein n=1 Tax=Anguilla anguilla TaxID=7936 RepID=A0A0E9UAU2_ANGAN